MANRVNSSSNLPIRERLGLRPIINASGTTPTKSTAGTLKWPD